MINPNSIDKLTFWKVNSKKCTEQEELMLGILGLYIQPSCFGDINEFIPKIKRTRKDAIQIFKNLVNKGVIEFSKEIDWDKYV